MSYTRGARASISSRRCTLNRRSSRAFLNVIETCHRLHFGRIFADWFCLLCCSMRRLVQIRAACTPAMPRRQPAAAYATEYFHRRDRRAQSPPVSRTNMHSCWSTCTRVIIASVKPQRICWVMDHWLNLFQATPTLPQYGWNTKVKMRQPSSLHSHCLQVGQRPYGVQS